jgi:TPR repeat protein
MYHEGLGIPKNDPEAFKWYTKAAEQGEGKAQFYLGRMYRYGEGIPKNYEQAIKWYTKAGEKGYAAAQVGLGDMYKYGWDDKYGWANWDIPANDKRKALD